MMFACHHSGYFEHRLDASGDLGWEGHVFITCFLPRCLTNCYSCFVRNRYDFKEVILIYSFKLNKLLFI